MSSFRCLSLLLLYLFSFRCIASMTPPEIELNLEIIRACRSSSVSMLDFQDLVIRASTLNLNVPVSLGVNMKDGTIVQTTPLLASIFTPFYDIERVSFLLQHGADPDSFALPGGTTPLLFAVQRGDRQLVSLLLNYRADFNRIDDDGFYSLSLAFYLQNADMIKHLLKYVMEYESPDGITSILPCVTDFFKMAELRLQLELLNEVSEEFQAEVAFEIGFFEAFNVLVKSSSQFRRNTALADILFNPFLYEAIGSYDILTIIDYALPIASKEGDLSQMQILLNNGANPNFNIWSPVVAAVESGQVNALNMLLRHGANFKSVQSEAIKTAEKYDTSNSLNQMLHAEKCIFNK